jgi:hypothetical protein
MSEFLSGIYAIYIDPEVADFSSINFSALKEANSFLITILESRVCPSVPIITKYGFYRHELAKFL